MVNEWRTATFGAGWNWDAKLLLSTSHLVGCSTRIYRGVPTVYIVRMEKFGLNVKCATQNRSQGAECLG